MQRRHVIAISWSMLFLYVISAQICSIEEPVELLRELLPHSHHASHDHNNVSQHADGHNHDQGHSHSNHTHGEQNDDICCDDIDNVTMPRSQEFTITRSIEYTFPPLLTIAPTPSYLNYLNNSEYLRARDPVSLRLRDNYVRSCLLHAPPFYV